MLVCVCSCEQVNNSLSQKKTTLNQQWLISDDSPTGKHDQKDRQGDDIDNHSCLFSTCGSCGPGQAGWGSGTRGNRNGEVEKNTVRDIEYK